MKKIFTIFSIIFLLLTACNNSEANEQTNDDEQQSSIEDTFDYATLNEDEFEITSDFQYDVYPHLFTYKIDWENVNDDFAAFALGDSFVRVTDNGEEELEESTEETTDSETSTEEEASTAESLPATSEDDDYDEVPKGGGGIKADDYSIEYENEEELEELIGMPRYAEIKVDGTCWAKYCIDMGVLPDTAFIHTDGLIYDTEEMGTYELIDGTWEWYQWFDLE